MATEQDKIIVYVPKADGAALRAFCASEDKTMAAVIRRLIRDFLAATPKPQVKGEPHGTRPRTARP